MVKSCVDVLKEGALHQEEEKERKRRKVLFTVLFNFLAIFAYLKYNIYYIYLAFLLLEACVD